MRCCEYIIPLPLLCGFTCHFFFLTRHTKLPISFCNTIMIHCFLHFFLDAILYVLERVNVKWLHIFQVATWKSVQLLEILLYLGEAGHYTAVKELFKFPIQHCPDILVLGLVQVKSYFPRLLSLSPSPLATISLSSGIT